MLKTQQKLDNLVVLSTVIEVGSRSLVNSNETSEREDKDDLDTTRTLLLASVLNKLNKRGIK